MILPNFHVGVFSLLSAGYSTAILLPFIYKYTLGDFFADTAYRSDSTLQYFHGPAHSI